MHEDPFALLGNSSSNSGQSGESEEEAGKEEGEEKEEEETRSQVPLDTSTILANFLIPGGLNAFPIALPAKLDRLFLKDLPKPIRPTDISRRNFV